MAILCLPVLSTFLGVTNYMMGGILGCDCFHLFPKKEKYHDPECTALVRKRTESCLFIEDRYKWKITTELPQGIVLFH